MVKVENRTKNVDRSAEDAVQNNVWWPWKNYDDWLNGRGLKAERPKKKEKKGRKDKKERKKNKKNEKKRKKSKNGKKQQRPNAVIIDSSGGGVAGQSSTAAANGEDNEIMKKESIPEIQYKLSPIDMILKNSSLVPTLVKYSSRNYTYGKLLFFLLFI